MAKMEYRPGSVEFYSGDNFYRSGDIAAYCTADAAFPMAKAYDDLAVSASATSDAIIGFNSTCNDIGTITANTCAVSGYEPVVLKTDISEVENALKSVIARVTALEESMPRRDNLRRELKTLNYKREL